MMKASYFLLQSSLGTSAPEFLSVTAAKRSFPGGVGLTTLERPACFGRMGEVFTGNREKGKFLECPIYLCLV